MKTVRVDITGTTPLLMHADNIEWADRMDEWKSKPENKAKSKAGDDRTPPWRWIGCLNYDDPKNGVVTIPSEYIMRSIMGGAAQVPTGKGKGTFKSLSQSGLLCESFHWPLLIDGKTVRMSDIMSLIDAETFKENAEGAEALGFSLFVKRAKIGQSKHVRVRPRFDNWALSGEITITDDLISRGYPAIDSDDLGAREGLGRLASRISDSWRLRDVHCNSYASDEGKEGGIVTHGRARRERGLVWLGPIRQEPGEARGPMARTHTRFRLSRLGMAVLGGAWLCLARLGTVWALRRSTHTSLIGQGKA